MSLFVVSLLQPPLPVVLKLIRSLANDSSRLKAFNYSNVDITITLPRIHRMKMFYANRGTRENLIACLWVKRLFPDLRMKPLRKLARFAWHHTKDLIYFEHELQLLKIS